MSHWWRAYDEAVDDPKLQRLPAETFKAWFNIMCLASKNSGVLPPLSDVAFKLRISDEKAKKVLTELQKAGLLDRIDGGCLEPHNWKERQHRHDISTERVRAFRERHAKRNGATA